MSVAPLQFLLLVFAGWVNRRQVDILEYLQEENRVLREQLGDRRLPWIQQIARNLTDSVDGFLRGKRYLIHDRDPLFTAAFRAVLRAAGIECLKLPPQSPNLNSVAERFVLSIKRECLDKIVPLGERHLRLAVSEFVEHYHRERNHQGLDNRLIIAPANDNADPARPIARRERLGGLLSYYYRAVA